MERHCSQHNKPAIIACLQKDCQQTFICLVCHKTHNEDHQIEILNQLEKDRSWIIQHEKDKESLANNRLLVSKPSQYDLVNYNIKVIQKMIEELIIKIKEKEKQLIEEMTRRFEEQNPINKATSTLKKCEEVLNKTTFEIEDIYDLVKEVKDFQEERHTKIKKSLVLIEDEVRAWTINSTKILQTKTVIANSIEKLNLDDLFTYNCLEDDEKSDQFIQQGYDFFTKQENNFSDLRLLKIQKNKTFHKELRDIKKSLEEKSEQLVQVGISKSKLEEDIIKYENEKKDLNNLITSSKENYQNILTDSSNCGTKYTHYSGRRIYYCKGADPKKSKCTSLECEINCYIPQFQVIEHEYELKGYAY